MGANDRRVPAGFSGGGDRLRYEIPMSSPGPFEIDVELRYQAIGYRWAHNLESYDAPEPKRFAGYYTSMSSAASVVVARATARAGQ